MAQIYCARYRPDSFAVVNEHQAMKHSDFALTSSQEDNQAEDTSSFHSRAYTPSGRSLSIQWSRLGTTTAKSKASFDATPPSQTSFNVSAALDDHAGRNVTFEQRQDDRYPNVAKSLLTKSGRKLKRHGSKLSLLLSATREGIGSQDVPWTDKAESRKQLPAGNPNHGRACPSLA